MKSLVQTLALMMALGVPGALLAQWPNYPTPGVPKGPDGKPDLNGPTPECGTLLGRRDRYPRTEASRGNCPSHPRPRPRVGLGWDLVPLE